MVSAVAALPDEIEVEAARAPATLGVDTTSCAATCTSSRRRVATVKDTLPGVAPSAVAIDWPYSVRSCALGDVGMVSATLDETASVTGARVRNDAERSYFAKRMTCLGM